MSIATTVRLAASAFGAPAFVVLANTPYQPMRAAHGVDEDRRARYQALFASIEPASEVLLIEDASNAEAQRAHPWLSSAPELQFVAGAPLRLEDGTAAGMLYVVDETAPRSVGAADAAMLSKLARLAADDLQPLPDVPAASFTDRQLVAEQAFIESALNALNEVFFVVAPDGTFLRWNDRVTEVTGYRDEEIAAMHPSDFFCADDAPRVRRAIEQALRDGQACVEAELRTKDDRLISYEFTGSALTDRAGTLMGICGVGRDVSACKSAERALQESEHRWRALVENHPDPVVVSRRGTIVYANPATARFFGATSAEAIRGRSIAEVVPDDQQEALRERIEAVEAGETLGTREYTLFTIDGEQRVVEAQGVPIRHNGAPAVQTVVRDVTERKHAEAALRESQEQLQLALEAATMGIWDWDIQHDELLTSASARRIFGVESCIPTKSSDDFMAYVHPEDRQCVRTAMRTAVASRKQLNEEFRICQPDGTTRWVNTRGRVHTNAQNEPIRMIGTVLDITERKAADRALRDSEALNRAMLQAIPDLIFRFSSDGVYLNVEADQQGQLAEPIDQLLGRSVTEVLPPEVAELWMTMIEDALATGTVQQGEYPLITQEGKECIFEARVAPLNGEEVEAIVRDITERKRQQQRLVEAKERAEEMNRLKSAFLANMSHELRTPLTAILGFAEILSEEIADQNRDFARLIAQSGRRLMETLNSVLDLAQLESRTVTLETARTDLRERVEEAVSMFELRASDQEIHLRADLPDTPVWAVIDASALDRVLSNLISNALKFTPEGEVRIDAQATEEGAEIQVQDTGVGIDAEFLPHIFDEFRQESTGSSREFDGVGLGLTITRRLVRQMDGQIDVESTKGKGTIFTVRFPPAPPEGEVER